VVHCSRYKIEKLICNVNSFIRRESWQNLFVRDVVTELRLPVEEAAVPPDQVIMSILQTKYALRIAYEV
jgi:hypothetical protein